MGRKKAAQKEWEDWQEAPKQPEGAKRDLLGDDDEEETTLRINKEYAKGYDAEKQRKEIDSIRGRVSQWEEEDSSEGTIEDEDGMLLDDSRDLGIMEALAHLRRGEKDKAAEKISQVNTEVEKHLHTLLTDEPAEKKYTMKDHLRKTLLEKGAEGTAFAEEEEEKAFAKTK
eukprot:Sspe_Gene.107185::Locus_85267_Transcript_1_1_Confidence_1.000_Length_558::g.107185::m.107185